MPLIVNGQQVNLDITATNNASPVIKQVAADVNGLETSVKNAGEGVDEANTPLNSMILTAGRLASALSVVTAVAGTIGGAFELGEIASANERLRQSGESLADSYNESLDRIVAKVSEASLGTVSDMAIIESANKAMMLGVGGSAEQLAQLMEIAAFRGRAMGISTTQAFDDMVRGIGRMSPMILDNLGIVVDADGTYGAYAESIGKSSSELSRAEKIQALLNKVLEEGNRMLEDAGGLAQDNAGKFERWNAELENTKNVYSENAIVMAEVANFGADLLVNFQDRMIAARQVREEYGLLSNAEFTRLTLMQVEKNEMIEVSTARMEGLATIYQTIDATEELAAVTVTSTEVTKEAVQGAIKVQEAYEKYGDKLADLQSEHDELKAKKQDLINQGYWPEHEAILKLNDKLAENEQKQKDVTEAMKGTLDQMILNTAAAGLDAEGQLALARATGQIDEATYEALSAQMLLKKEYDEGRLSAEQYAKKTVELRDAVNRLESKGIKITVDAILNEVRNVTTVFSQKGTGSAATQAYGFAEGTDGWQTVPSGYPNDTYPILLTSGERFAVIPQGVAAAPSMGGGLGGGGTYVHVTYAPGMSFGDENSAMNNLKSTFLALLEEAKADGQVD